MAVNWYRISELDHLDSIGTNAVQRTADEIRKCVGDPGLYESVVLKVARAMVERRISPNRVGEICDLILSRRRNNFEWDKSPGRYFVKCMKGEFAKAGIPWYGPKEGPNE